MSELCRFRGAVIQIFFRDHNPPHFHVLHGDHMAEVGIENVLITEGSLPRHIERLVLEWARVRQVELRRAWESAQNDETPGKIAPLD